MNAEYTSIIRLIQDAYSKATGAWCLGFSGGKDSTALLILVLNAIRTIPENPNCKINVVYCDTGVEFPAISSLVKKQLSELDLELSLAGIKNVSFYVEYPAIEDRFFSMVIGKGYVPPTFLYRWCTRRLRTKPLHSIIEANTPNTIILGIRNGESNTRDRVIKNHKIEHFYSKQSDYPKSVVFCPIIDFSVADVWNVINSSLFPISIAREELRKLYSCIGTAFSQDGEYLSDTNRGRFGCWTCTVVRNDLAMDGLIECGHNELSPLREFMIWLKTIRDDYSLREKNRITGKEGKGPFKIETRKEILYKLQKAQDESGIPLLSSQELEYIMDCFNNSSADSES